MKNMRLSQNVLVIFIRHAGIFVSVGGCANTRREGMPEKFPRRITALIYAILVVDGLTALAFMSACCSRLLLTSWFLCESGWVNWLSSII